MGRFAEVLTNNQAKNINKISDKIGKKLETFNNSLKAYNKANSSTGVATISINPNKTKVMGAATINVNPRNTARAHTSSEDGGSSSCQEEATDTRKGKRKRKRNFNINKKVVRETGDDHPPAEVRLILQIIVMNLNLNRVVRVTSSNILLNDFSAVDQTGPPIGKNVASIINNVMFKPVNREKLIKKL